MNRSVIFRSVISRVVRYLLKSQSSSTNINILKDNIINKPKLLFLSRYYIQKNELFNISIVSWEINQNISSLTGRVKFDYWIFFKFDTEGKKEKSRCTYYCKMCTPTPVKKQPVFGIEHFVRIWKLSPVCGIIFVKRP